MSQQNSDMSNLVYRLKARLALANFKREHGFENIDFHTLESSLIESNNTQPTTAHSIRFKSKKRRNSPSHRFYQTLSPPTGNKMDRLIKKNACHSSVHMPVSEQRSTSPRQRSKVIYSNNTTMYSSDDEDAAHLLVMMHQSPSMSS